MILGSEALGGMVRALMPKAEITKRPRFSTLSYAGAKKLSRLPKRSAIVAFSAEEVYAVAEMLRRARGGAVVVMGALSPRTRNAQVAMFQAGEVDYLVATDAIGMGLNMDLNHVAFASLSKFDGHRQRRLSVSEMAQIAGRAGRHQRDGTFGSLGGEEMFRPEEVEAIEEHRFPRIEHLYWRDGDPDVSSLASLIAALEARPGRPELRTAPEAVDLAVLKRLADEPLVRERARHPARVARLWEACGLPDFRKVGPEHHAKTVLRIYRHLTENTGHIPTDWFAAEIARLDEIGGDIPALGGRIAAARTWAYIAHRADWLADPKHWAARTEALEEKLSDALHKKLTERFVDRRTTVLMRAIGADPAMLDVGVADDGTVSVEDEPIGRLDGFAFTVDPSARVGERKRLLAAAERRLPKERARRAQALVDASDGDFALVADPVGIAWRQTIVARLAPGRTLLEPRVVPDPAIGLLSVIDRERVSQRTESWLTNTLNRHLKPLFAMAATGGDLFTPPRVRALLAPLAAGGGSIERTAIEGPLSALDGNDRRILRAAGLTVGTLDLYDSRLLKPEPLRWIAALRAVRAKAAMPKLPAPGATVTDGADPLPGFRKFGSKQVRIDMIERIARALHDRRQARLPFIPDPALATSFGVDAATFALILRACGFRAESGGNWVWRNRPRGSPPKPTPQSPHFAALEGWAGRV